MAVRLFSHNADAYLKVLAMLNTEGKAAVIHPTGTGKSFIGFMLAGDNPESRVLWLTPSEYIVKTQLENLRREGGAELNNITFITYAKLMLMSAEETAELAPDYIIMDEFHRGGAVCWNRELIKLIQAFPEAKLLGLSATNIRYLDNQRNMANELFDGNIASEMTLGEAIVRGILCPPKYVISVYGYSRELQKYEERVDAISNEGVRNRNKRELDRLRRALEASAGLETVFNKHMTNRSGKYIVFCSNRAHLDEMVSHAYEWFSGVDPDMHIYKVYSDDPTASKEFLSFKDDDSSHLKLLYCIDMLNEGVHVKNIDGVVLFRPTVSPIIYKQQIGRALSADKSKTPVIFDVVNNFENLYSISTIQEEIDLAVSYYRSLGEENKIVCDSFEITDETCDCRDLFRNLESSLSSTWEMYFQAAKQYFEEHGNLNVPKRYITPDGLTLGVWIGTQRRVRNGSIGGIITEDKIQRLDSIGMVWENVLEKRWEEGFSHAEAYYKENGNLDVPALYEAPDGYKLGAWINRNREWYKNNSHMELLDSERVRRLNEIGMLWSRNNAAWEKQYLAAAEYYKENGDLNVPSDYINKDGIKLGAWINRQKRAYKSGKLTEEQAERLELIGMYWQNKYDSAWTEVYNEAAEYYKKHGNLDVPAGYKTKTGITLRKWLYNQCANKKLDSERRKLLCSIGMKREEKDPWTEKYELAKAYYEKHGNIDIAQDYKTESGVWLGKWIYEQRKCKDSLTEERVKLLEGIGMDWRLRSEVLWDSKCAEAEKFLKKNGNLQMPNQSLTVWIYKQTRLFKENRLNPIQTKRFGELLRGAHRI